MKRLVQTVVAIAAALAIGACGGESIKQKPQLKTDRLLMNFGQEFGEAVYVGAQKTEALILSNDGLEDLIIQSITIEGEGFSGSGPTAGELDAGSVTLPFAVKGRRRIFYDVTFRPNADKDFFGKITITSNGENAAPDGGPAGQVFIDLAGSGVKQEPQIAVTPATVDFGAVPANTDARASVAIRNVGGTDMTISGVTLTADAGFSGEGFVQAYADGGMAPATEPLPLLLVQGASYFYRLKFTPRAAGTFTGALTVISDAQNAPSKAVPLTGRGN